MVRNLVEEVGTCLTRHELQQFQHWPAKLAKFCSRWNLHVEQNPPLDPDAICMKSDCAVPCFCKCNTIVNLYTVT